MPNAPASSPTTPPLTIAVAWPLGLPVLAQGAVLAFGPGDSLGAFQAGAAAITFAGLAFSFVPLRPRPLGGLLALVALVAGVTHALAVGPAGAPALAWLVLAVSLAGSGLAALGRALKVSPLGAGVVAAALLCVGLTSTSWADSVAAGVPQAKRAAFVQACVHLDPLMACAYGAADHDRLHDADVYDQLPLASSLIERPAPLPTGALWLVVGLVLYGAALVIASRRLA